jgi:hypothetical protein
MLQGVERIGRFRAGPQQVDQARGRNDPPALQGEDRRERALTPAWEIDGASLAGDRESAEDTDGDGHEPSGQCSTTGVRGVSGRIPRCADHGTDNVSSPRCVTDP